MLELLKDNFYEKILKYDIACEQALHLGDIVKSTRARGTREETRLRSAAPRRSLARSRAARFARPNRRVCSQAKYDIYCGLSVTSVVPALFLITTISRCHS